jgi:hypothetical protein
MSHHSTSKWSRLRPRPTHAIAILGSIGALAYFARHLAADDSASDPPASHSESASQNQQQLAANLRNRQPLYIDAPNIENLISLPRYKLALFNAKQLSRAYTPAAAQHLIDELAKLNLDASTNRAISDAFIHQIGHVLLSEELQFEMALKGMNI